MKKILYTLITLSSILTISFAQVTTQIADKSISDKIDIPKSYPIPGSHHLFEKEQKLREFYDQNPNAQKFPLSKPVDWDFSVGSTHEFWAQYFEEQDNGDQQYQVPSTCRAVGTNCYVFVEDAVWGTGQVDQTAVDAITSEFDSNIFPTDVATFGTPPNVDNDDKIIILILDIQDGWSESTGGGYTAGYFYSLNERPDRPGEDGFRSNEAEIFYMDCNPADLITDQTDVLNTTAHEFQHMIHFAHDENEMTFINEALSEIASYICGYGLRSNGLYAQNPNRNLLFWDYDDTLPDYSRAAHWMLYIYEQYPGSDILMDFVNNSHSEWAAIDNTLRKEDATRGFLSIFEDWLIANYTNGSSSNSKYNFQYSPRTNSAPVATHIGNIGDGSGTIQPLSAEYISFSSGDDLTITFSGDIGYTIKALKIGSLEVEDVTLNQPYTPSGYGSTYPEVAFLIYNNSPGATKNYAYSATGSEVSANMELAFEDGVPEGYLEFVEGDSSAVLFSGPSGAKLDSIKVAFRRSGKIQMDISEVDGQNFMRGKTLYGPKEISSLKETASTSPYPVPYDNWKKINLTSSNIDVSNEFIVSFLIGADPSEPGIMISSEPDDGIRSSRTYYKSDDTWYYISDSGNPGNIFKYLIRAYVSIGGGTVAIDQNGIVSIPDDFSLGENYPNPFNPTTTFNFATPKDGLVNFTVHDLLGRVIYSEHRNLLAGNYSFTWDGQNNLEQQVVSGVYFLKMEADGFAQTRKMLMMK